MPSVKKYQSENGYYIRSNIQGRFVTLQLSPEAEGLLSDLGFQDDENISWQFLKPLCDSGHAYTNKSGTEVSTDAIDIDGAVSSGRLNPEDQQRLEEFIEEHAPDHGESEKAANPSDRDQSSTSIEDIDEPKRGFVEKWSPSDEEYEATLNRIARANNGDGILKSIAHHATEHPMSPKRFRVSSREIPTYSFETGDVAWTVHDYRTVRNVSTDASLFFDIQPGTERSQSITIETGAIEWHTKGDRFSSKQIDDFVRVAPEILYYTRHLVSSPTINPQKIIDGEAATVPSQESTRIEELTEIQPVEPADYPRSLGAVLSLGEKGYGRIRAHTGHTFKFTTEDAKGENIEPSDVVSFAVKPHRGTVYADEILREDFGLPSSTVVDRWPEWNDKSLAWIRENWSDNDDQAETRTDTIVLTREEDTKELECLTVTVDLLSHHLVVNADETAEIIDDAVRSLLKDSIDGALPVPHSPAATTEIEISLPKNLISMIDSVIDTSPDYESRGQFFNAALEQHLEQDETVELTVRVPRGHREVAEQLAEDRDMSTSEFMRAALENLIGTEIRRKE